MKLWIIYKNGIGFSKIIAEMLQDRWEDYLDVYVGKVTKIDPALLVEEKFDFLIIGDILSKEIPSLEIQNWLLKYWEISKKKKILLKAISGYYITLSDILSEHSWVEFLQDNVNVDIIFPPILHLKIDKARLVLENGALELFKDYSNDFIEFIINNKKSKKKEVVNYYKI